MSSVFVLFFVGLAGALAALGGMLAVRFWTRTVAVRSLRKARPEGQGLRAIETRLSVEVLAVLSLALGAAWLAAGRPIFGLLVLPALPQLAAWRLARLREKDRRRLEASALSFLRALQGLVATGLSLPSALFHLSRALEAPFADALEGALDRYEGGRSLSECLDRFRHRTKLDRVGAFLAVLEMSYRQGLPILPLLDRRLPLLEAEAHADERVRELRRSAAAQITLAFAMPWILAGVLFGFQPALFHHLISRPLAWLVLSGALVWELFGVVLIWKTSRFI